MSRETLTDILTVRVVLLGSGLLCHHRATHGSKASMATAGMQSVPKVQGCGYSVLDLRGGGFTLAEILSAGFASADLFACEAMPGDAAEWKSSPA